MVESQNSFLKISTSTEVSQTQPSVKSLTQSVRSLQGLSLKNVTIRIIDKHNKKVHEDFGEMLFTHFGVSGPLILSASSHVRKIDNHILVLDLKPALTTDQLDKRIQRDFQTNSKKKIENVLKLLLPKKLIPVILELSDIDGNKQANQFTKEDRKKMIHCLKNLTIKLKKFRPIKEAIITSGGVDVNEINPKTMESKLVKGLFFTGEIIDVDAYTGGFNLQIAWSTGFAAGKSC
ncbi:MAG TPA: aminoacetone oxidase family FAD-binding enzyme [Candidatus Cloacimonetes bacterium]|nr:aminoacetone oxidase family FAD-binding enzyme [Candidatus Cloacimonadota bacterium]